jgi:ferritin-like metal-binding protein YciE
MKLNSLKELLVDELKDLFSAESQLVKALPNMAKAATNPELRAGFEKHLKQTHGHVARLEQVCAQLDVTPKGKKCAAMEGLIEEGKELLEGDATPVVLDAALIAAAQKVEHYEIASYGTVCTWAKLLGLEAAATLLAETLEEEKATDEKLTALAELTINDEANAGEVEEADDARTAKGKNGSARNGRGKAPATSAAHASR